MTNHWNDLANSDCILIMGSNPAENHPISFKWVLKAQDKGAKVVSVDPRFTHSSSKADFYVQLRVGTDIAFLGGMINYILNNDKYFKQYVIDSTNGPTVVGERFGFSDGLFSGFNADKKSYDKKTWAFEMDANGVPVRDETLTHPRCVLQLLKKHYDRYTLDKVSETTGTPKEDLLRVYETFASTGAPDKAGTIMYAMGWTPEEAIGKRIYYNEENTQSMTIVGVVKDCAYRAPTNDVPNAIFVNTNKLEYMWPRCFVLFKYKPGTWEECRRRIEEMQLAELPDRKLFLDSEEERYNKYLKSEDALSGLLSFSSLVCILIAVFGIYSLVTLTCELRRKEIAVRKVNGATIGNILSIFFREYTLLLIISSLIAFPVGYIIMRQWIETYNRQVNIGVWPFILIFMGIMIVITLSIGWRVWQAARQNPAEVIKSE